MAGRTHESDRAGGSKRKRSAEVRRGAQRLEGGAGVATQRLHCDHAEEGRVELVARGLLRKPACQAGRSEACLTETAVAGTAAGKASLPDGAPMEALSLAAVWIDEEIGAAGFCGEGRHTLFRGDEGAWWPSAETNEAHDESELAWRSAC